MNNLASSPKNLTRSQIIVGFIAAGITIFFLAKCSETGGSSSDLIPYRILGTAGSTKAKGQWQVEVDLVAGRFPNVSELGAILNKLADAEGGLETHERYFVEFYFPGMNEKNGGSGTGYALAKLDPDVRIRFHELNQEEWPEKFRGLPVPSDTW